MWAKERAAEDARREQARLRQLAERRREIESQLSDGRLTAVVAPNALELGLDIGQLDVLERYQRWRRSDNVLLLAVTDGLTRLFSNDIDTLKVMRDLGLAAVDRLPGLKKLFMAHASGSVGKLPRLLQG